MTPPSEKDPRHDPLADLDDDLGDDWESAFQAEDFMFSPEDESSDFFLFDENSPQDNEDIADLFADQQEGEASIGTEGAAVSGEAAAAEGEGVVQFPNRQQILAATLLQFFTARPRAQRLLIAAIPVLLVVMVSSLLFFRNTSNELAHLDLGMDGNTGVHAPPDQQQEAVSPTPPQPPQLPEVAKVSKKWQLPSFIIVASDDQHNLVITIDLNLIAQLEEGQELPEDKMTFVRDIIYQFYQNRPPYELKRYALARGEMISQLSAWLNKQWPANPFDTITFSRYQVKQTTPSLSPKLTFM